VAVRARPFGVEETSVGRKADPRQSGKSREASADTEVTGVVDGGLGSERLSLFVVLLDVGVRVVDVTRRGDPNGDDPGARAPGCATGHAPLEERET